MSEEIVSTFQLTYCYAPEDQPWRDEIDRHLSGFKQRGQITRIDDAPLPQLGNENQQPINLQSADLVVLLVTEHFHMADQATIRHMRWILENLRRSGACYVIALLLEDVPW